MKKCFSFLSSASEPVRFSSEYEPAAADETLRRRREGRKVTQGEKRTGPRSSAFTLVEILIVLAIIGILSSVIIASTTLSRAKARDTRRIADMKEIQLGLALYYDVNKVYPAGSDVSALNVLVTQKYLPTIPTDPSPGNAYEYMVTNGKYCFGVKLEGEIPNDSASCTSKSTGSVANYKASPPNQ